MANLFRTFVTGVVAAASLGAMVAATSTPANAWGRRGGGFGWGPGIAAGIVGGLALGALAARPTYAAPVYGYGPGYDPYVPDCHREWRPVYRFDGAYLGDRPVRVCP